MPYILFILISNIHSDLKPNFARIRRWLHGDADAIEVVIFRLDKIVVLKPTKHHIVVELKVLSFTVEFGAHSQKPLLFIVQQLGL